ncbi:MAG: hypothetical protein Q9191_007760 [Dirinaria sp. TL-2023a]
MPLIDYFLEGPKQPSRYNDITVIGPDPLKPWTPPVDLENEDESHYVDEFHVSTKNGGSIMPELVNCPDRYVTEAFEPFKKRLRKNWVKGFQALMKWLETLTDGSGLYDQGFSEGVIDSMDFDYYTYYLHGGDKKVEWYCIDGGTALLPQAMQDKLGENFSSKVGLNQRVKSIALQRDDPPTSATKMPGSSAIKIRVNEEKEPRKYAAVFNTTTLACLQRIDLTGLELLYEQKDAIRSLHYDTASKVGMKFQTNWWKKYGINKGGLGKTDMPLRTCVYPSYNIHDREGPYVLLVSYCWAQDAARLSSLMVKGEPEKEIELKEMLIHNLTWLHLENAKAWAKDHDKKMDFDILHDEIANSYITHHAFNWHDDPFTSGAYAKFAPGQFQNLYPALSCPTADDRFFFVGEAVSAHHGWIVGALDSAHMAVIRFLKSFGLFEEFGHRVADPNNEDYIQWLGPLPDEYSPETVEKQVSLGQLQPDERMAARVAVEKAKTGAEVRIES